MLIQRFEINESWNTTVEVFEWWSFKELEKWFEEEG